MHTQQRHAMTPPGATLVRTVLALALLCGPCAPFSPAGLGKRAASTRTRLRGIQEWRDADFPPPAAAPRGIRPGATSEALPRRVGVFPFDLSDVRVTGETKDLHLYEPRFLKLFDDVMESYCGVVAMGLIAPSGILRTAPLCQVDAFTRMGAGPNDGIFVTLRVVGRCTITEVVDGGIDAPPYLVAGCVESADVGTMAEEDADKAELAADAVENGFLELGRLEAALAALAPADKKGAAAPTDANGEFRAAVAAAARAAEHTGFVVRDGDGDAQERRSVADLTALSWAAFGTSRALAGDKLMALDSFDLLERLRMAQGVLGERRKEAAAKLALAKLQSDDQTEDEDLFPQ